MNSLSGSFQLFPAESRRSASEQTGGKSGWPPPTHACRPMPATRTAPVAYRKRTFAGGLAFEAWIRERTSVQEIDFSA